ncbi:MAG TPA: hypothetical protein VFA90_03985, partial [Terriglobales bacterium]|nr:hypothetical protein [Terriglobales bacterium]
MPPILMVHVVAGTLGLTSGAAAISFRKGSPRHVQAGRIFVAAMLTMAAGAVYLAILKHQAANILGGVLVFYLITTGWLTARRGDGQTSRVDWGVLLIPLAGGSWVGFIGLEKLLSHMPPNDGVPLGIDFLVASVMLLAAAGDIRMMVRCGLFGTERRMRHLWRMCFALFIATGSFFLGPANRPLRLLASIGFR